METNTEYILKPDNPESTELLAIGKLVKTALEILEGKDKTSKLHRNTLIHYWDTIRMRKYDYNEEQANYAADLEATIEYILDKTSPLKRRQL